jgi:hypothetical protein
VRIEATKTTGRGPSVAAATDTMKEGPMPLTIDVQHNVDGLTADAVKGAPARKERTW